MEKGYLGRGLSSWRVTGRMSRSIIKQVPPEGRVVIQAEKVGCESAGRLETWRCLLKGAVCGSGESPVYRDLLAQW
jgi:hypothetical protein